MRSKVFRLSADAADRRCFYYFLMAVIVIRYETTATARWTSPFIVRAFFNDTITIAVWTGFHVRLITCYHTPLMGARPCAHDANGSVMRWCFSALPPKADICSAPAHVRFGSEADIH